MPNFDRLFNQSQGDELINTLKGIKNTLEANFPLEDVEVELSANSQFITPSEGYFAINSVIVPAASQGSVQLIDRSGQLSYNLADIFNVPCEISNNVTDCWMMFSGLNNFNSPVTIPDSVTDTSEMFSGCPNFNAPITMGANMNAYVYMANMFNGCANYNQPTVFPKGELTYALAECTNFNSEVVLSPISNCYSLFYNCVSYNRPITLPEYSCFESMFDKCNNFNQPLGIPNGSDCTSMLLNCNSFNSPVVFKGSLDNSVNSVSNMFGASMTAPIYIMNANLLFGEDGGQLLYANELISDIYLTGYTDSCLSIPDDYGRRVNIYTDDNSIANMTNVIMNPSNWNYVPLTYQTDAANNCQYNSQYNLYIYNTWDGTLPDELVNL